MFQFRDIPSIQAVYDRYLFVTDFIKAWGTNKKQPTFIQDQRLALWQWEEHNAEMHASPLAVVSVASTSNNPVQPARSGRKGKGKAQTGQSPQNHQMQSEVCWHPRQQAQAPADATCLQVAELAVNVTLPQTRQKTCNTVQNDSMDVDKGGHGVIVALVACASTQRVWHKYLVD